MDDAGPAGSAPVVLVLGPDRQAISGVSTHVNLLFESGLDGPFRLHHFQVGSEGRQEGWLARSLRLLVSPFQLALRLRRERVELMHVNTSLNPKSFWRDLCYMLVAWLSGVRILYQIHGGSLLTFPGKSRVRRFAMRLALHLASVVVVLSARELAACRSFAPGQTIRLVPNGIDPQQYAGLARRSALRGSDIVLLYIGRLSREKGLFEALHALRLARLQGAAARLIIAGGGPEEAALRSLVLTLHLENAVEFTGPVFDEAKLALLGAADVLLLPSYSEGLPYALLECMAAGMPAIITAVGGIPDVVIDGCHGLLVTPRDTQAIARAIVRLAGHPEEIVRMGTASRERIVNGYSLQCLAREFGALYASFRSVPRGGIAHAD